jgi:hypothetical protein
MNEFQERIYEMIDAVRIYRKRHLDFKDNLDYITACDAGSRLLKELGEEGVRHRDLEGNGKGFRHFIKSLQVLSTQSERTVKDMELIEIVYEDSLRHAGEVEAELNYSLRALR